MHAGPDSVLLRGDVAGLVMGLSGFMMAHVGHTGMVSGAAWTPLLLWSLERIALASQPGLAGAGRAVCLMQLCVIRS
jgi:hypothetical protein